MRRVSIMLCLFIGFSSFYGVNASVTAAEQALIDALTAAISAIGNTIPTVAQQDLVVTSALASGTGINVTGSSLTTEKLKATAHAMTPPLSVIMVNGLLYVVDCDWRDNSPGTHATTEECLAASGVSYSQIQPGSGGLIPWGTTDALWCADVKKQKQQFVNCAYKNRPQCCAHIKHLVNKYFTELSVSNELRQDCNDDIYCPTEQHHKTTTFNSPATSLRAPIFMMVVFAGLHAVSSFNFAT